MSGIFILGFYLTAAFSPCILSVLCEELINWCDYECGFVSCQIPLAPGLWLSYQKKIRTWQADSRGRAAGSMASLTSLLTVIQKCPANTIGPAEDRKACSTGYSSKSLDIMAGMLSQHDSPIKERSVWFQLSKTSPMRQNCDYLAKDCLSGKPMRLSESWCWNAARQAIIYRISL